MAFYYPEGYFGPVCDALVDDAVIANRSRTALTETGDEREDVYRIDDSVFDAVTDIYDNFFAIKAQRCKVRTLADGTKEYYDCVFEHVADLPTLQPPPYDPDFLNRGIGVSDTFFVPNIGPDACSPFDEDINIRPTAFFEPDGTQILKYKRERSSPVTFPVTSSTEAVVTASDLTAVFDSNGNLVIGGTGTGIVYFDFEWDDNPNTYGTALGTYSVAGISFTQTPGVEEGNENNSAEVTAQTYTATITGNSGGFTVKNSGKQLCFRDNDGNDCNASLTITNVISVDTVANSSYWSEEGNTYGVWVNPEVCTLPQQEQQVTYFVDIPATDTYAFRFGCDDNGQVFLNDETTPIHDVAGGIFNGGALSTPYVVTRTITAGRLKVTVRVTNSDAGFVDSEGLPEGLAYSWQRNPGGWFLKICRGTGCSDGTTIADWVRAGPHQGWGSFMNQYAVYVSNTDSSVGTHTTTWNIVTPTTGDYTLEYAADNTGTFSFDGTQVASSTNFTTSNTVTLQNVSEGNHSISVSITNNSESENSWSNNPGGIAWKLVKPAETVTEQQSTTTVTQSNLTATFNSNGDLVVGGTGTGRVQLLFEWDDNPYTNGTALGQITIADNTFRQNNGQEEGSRDRIINVAAGTTYPAAIQNNPGGFSVENSGLKLCFRDLDGNDCNATLRIVTILNDPPITSTSVQDVSTQIPESVVASSLDISTSSGGNLIWHTRMATGYEFYEP